MIKTLFKIRIDEKILRKAYIKVSNIILTDEILDALPQTQGKGMGGHLFYFFLIRQFCCCVASVASDSVPPHKRQPTRLLHLRDSQGKNTGLGCHFLLQCMKAKSESEVAQSCPTLSDPMDCSLPGSSVHGIFQARVLEWGATALSEGSFRLTEKLRKLQRLIYPWC